MDTILLKWQNPMASYWHISALKVEHTLPLCFDMPINVMCQENSIAEKVSKTIDNDLDEYYKWRLSLSECILEPECVYLLTSDWIPLATCFQLPLCSSISCSYFNIMMYQFVLFTFQQEDRIIKHKHYLHLEKKTGSSMITLSCERTRAQKSTHRFCTCTNPISWYCFCSAIRIVNWC